MRTNKNLRRKKSVRNQKILLVAVLLTLFSYLFMLCYAQFKGPNKNVNIVEAITPYYQSEIASNKNLSSKQSAKAVSKQSTVSKLLDIPYIDQRIKYPNGCESVAAVMAAKYAGINIDADTFIDNYLDRGIIPYVNENGKWVGCDPAVAYPGDPRLDTGWGCYAPVITKALTKLVDKNKFIVRELDNISLPTLCEMYIDYDIPVIVWATIGMETPRKGMSWTVPDTNKTITWTNPLHCLVLVGYDEQYYYFNDSLSGKKCKYNKKSTEAAYAGLESQAVVVYPIGKVYLSPTSTD